MALTKLNDIAIHEAGHVLINYLMSDLVEIKWVTIDANHSKRVDESSDGGLFYQYLKHPNSLNILDMDQFCLSYLSGLAADLVNEHDGSITDDYFYTDAFPLKVQHYNYQGDMIAFNNFFYHLVPMLKVSPAQYNYESIKFLTGLFSSPEIVKALIGVRDLIEDSQTVPGIHLNNFLDLTYFGDWKKNLWKSFKENRKKLFVPLAE